MEAVTSRSNIMIKATMRGYDTECTSDGVTRVVSFNDRSEYRPEGFSFEDFMAFLFNPKTQTAPIMTYNLKFEINAILRTMPKEVCEKLYHEISTEYNGYQITLIPYKRITFIPINTEGIKRRTPQKPYPYARSNGKSLFDVASFLTYKTLQIASEQFLGKQKFNVAYDWVEEMQKCDTVTEELAELESHKELVTAYCKVDAMLTLELAEKIKEKYAEVGVPFNRPMSQANVLKSWLGKRKDYPTISREPKDLSTETAGWYEWGAKEAYHGGIFLTNQRGVFYDVWDADLNSAYPATLAKLPNWKNGVFFHPVFKQDYYEAEYGWYYCQFDCPYIPYRVYQDESIVEWVEGEPIRINTAPAKSYYVSGKRKQWITALEYKWLIRHYYKVKWLDGIIWRQRTEEYEKPFGWIPEFYARRKELKKAANEGDRQAAMMQHILKITMNSAYGITAQQEPRYTKFTNFYYSSYTTSECSTIVADFIWNNPDNVIQIATDGVLMKEKPTGIKIGKGLGEWDLVNYQKALIVGNGILQMFGSDYNPLWYQMFNGEDLNYWYETRARGVTSERNYNLLEEIQARPNEQIIKTYKRRPVGLGELLQSRKMKWSDLNTFKVFERRIDVNGEKNRKWSRQYKDWKDFLKEPSTSKPLKVRDMPRAKRVRPEVKKKVKRRDEEKKQIEVLGMGYEV